ncbi:hypothetical protein ACIBG6_38620 [Streptomyces sp. NPDC050842]|uniref:hypothetical protein n=1 Tax=Streptomyces sp. NPDC050842 TaxID=3365636 RepID=UPI0037B4E308
MTAQTAQAATGEPMPGIGDLLRDQERGCDAVVTDFQGGKPLLRHRYGGGEPWAAEPVALRIIARSGEWTQP